MNLPHIPADLPGQGDLVAWAADRDVTSLAEYAASSPMAAARVAITTLSVAAVMGWPDSEPDELLREIDAAVRALAAGSAPEPTGMLRRFRDGDYQSMATGGRIWIETAPGSNVYNTQTGYRLGRSPDTRPWVEEHYGIDRDLDPIPAGAKMSDSALMM